VYDKAIMSTNHIQEDITMAITNAKEALDGLLNADPAKVAGINAVILFDLSGEGGGKWTLKLADGEVGLEEGETDPPAMTLSMSAQDFVAMTNGELNAMAAFMQGKIRITGDMSLAMRLQNILT
jgi:alkyl sulfatase BDS1-like metallo-beta-lactamase superfamily hydrolase